MLSLIARYQLCTRTVVYSVVVEVWPCCSLIVWTIVVIDLCSHLAVQSKVPLSNQDPASLLHITQSLFFCGDNSPFCGATGTLCFGLHLMGFKARVDPVISDCSGQVLVLICNLGMMRLLLE